MPADSSTRAVPPIRGRGEDPTLMDVEEELFDLERKVKQLRLDYERYFLGTRPRAPSQLRSEVDKKIVIFSNAPIRNTALRFKLNSIVSRYQAFRRQWEEPLRKIDAGTYERHRFKAGLQQDRPVSGAADAAEAEPGLFERYRDARLAGALAALTASSTAALMAASAASSCSSARRPSCSCACGSRRPTRRRAARGASRRRPAPWARSRRRRTGSRPRSTSRSAPPRSRRGRTRSRRRR